MRRASRLDVAPTGGHSAQRCRADVSERVCRAVVMSGRGLARAFRRYDRRVHVCMLTDSLEPSGVGTHMVTLASELRDRRRISLALPATAVTGLEELAREFGLDVLRYGAAGGALEGVLSEARSRSCTCTRGWRGKVRSRSSQGDGPEAGRRADRAPPQLISTNDQRGRHRALVRQLDRLICVSEGVARSYAASGIPAGSITVVPNGTRPVNAPPSGWGFPTGYRSWSRSAAS